MPMQSILSFISAHWMEWAIGLLSFGWGYLIKKMTEYKNIKDGLLAIMHDRLYQMSTFFLKEGYITTAALKNLEYLYKKLSCSWRKWHWYRTVHSCQGSAN